MTVVERFLKLVSYETTSNEDCESCPSTPGQKLLGAELVRQLREIGITDAHMDEHGYVYGTIPANCDRKLPVLGLIAHMDTSPDASGKDVKPRITELYSGGDIILNEEKGIVLSPKDFPSLNAHTSKHLIVTDGTTLLGADDKAGVAEILSAAELLLSSSAPHGVIRIGFTPDEEIGRGADLFDVKGFGADYAYTVDGGTIGELEYENFNAASAKLVIHGRSVHPGDAKGKLISAMLVGMEFQSMLPAGETPAHTEGYEGFYHLTDFSGTVEQAALSYIIRDHDREKFEQRKKLVAELADTLNRKYGNGTVELTVRDSYYNMKEKLADCMFLITHAEQAMRDAGIEPVIVPIRGGTDGARLSYEGLPCPNLCTGGENYHGRFEYIPVEDMEAIVRMLALLCQSFAK